ncbi:hypothetical protein chiPu_0030905, partial [Chiloscyllium punctatum]|nr:hypothetical protein [Chiloscyllium punctatum]
NRVGGRAPARTGARDEPEPHGVAADRGRQRLVEEGADHVEAHRLRGPKRRAALDADLTPAQHPEKDLQERDRDGEAEPAQALDLDAGGEIVQIDLAQREIEQRGRDQDLDGRKQDSAHFGSRCQVSGCVKNSAKRFRAPKFVALVWFPHRSGNTRAGPYCGRWEGAAKQAGTGTSRRSPGV